MIGGIDDARGQTACNRCRHWHEHMPLRDPNDEDWGFGECRRNPPVLVSSMVAAQIERPAYGQQTDLTVDPLELSVATRFPVTSSTDWCGRHAAAPVAGEERGHVALLSERNRLLDRLDADDVTDSEAHVGVGRLNEIDRQMEKTPAVTKDDAVAKLVLLAQIATEGNEVDEVTAARVLWDVAPIIGIGRVSPNVPELAREA